MKIVLLGYSLIVTLILNLMVPALLLMGVLLLRARLRPNILACMVAGTSLVLVAALPTIWLHPFFAHCHFLPLPFLSRLALAASALVRVGWLAFAVGFLWYAADSERSPRH